MPDTNPYHIKNHDAMMKKYYSTKVGQESLRLQIEKCKEEMKKLSEKMHKLEKLHHITVQCKPYDIEILSDKGLVCAKLDCQYR